MEVWNDLLRVSLLGTERQPVSLPSSDDALGAVLGKLKAEDREGTLLSAAAAVSLYRRAGRLAATDATAPVACDRKDSPRFNAHAATFLATMLNGTHEAVLPEFLAAAAAAGKRVPEEKLPKLLELGSKKDELREMIVAVAGKRGAWLAAQNTEWSYASGGTATEDAKNLWETGDSGARGALLKRLRKSDPDKARELVQSTWKEDSPDDRAAFIAAFEAGLSLKDEEFLEAALDDKRKEVRQSAAELLARMPDSKLVKRMIERVKPLLTFTPGKKGLLAKLARSSAKLDVELPKECDKAMLRDGIAPKPPAGEKIGDKAWWLMQMAAAIPPSYWTTNWQGTPTEIITAANATDYSSVLLNVWATACVRFNDVTWAGVLLETVPTLGDFAPDVVNVLSPDMLESHALKWLEEDKLALSDESNSFIILSRCKHAWSRKLSQVFLKKLKLAAAQDATKKFRAWHLRAKLADFARQIPPALCSEALSDWPKDSDAWDQWREHIDKFLTTLQFRHDMLEALKEA